MKVRPVLVSVELLTDKSIKAVKESLKVLFGTELVQVQDNVIKADKVKK